MRDKYESPLSSRYASEKMLYLFSPDNKFRTWRRLWVLLASAEKELGLPITAEQIEQLIAFQDHINYEDAEEYERILRHDVMAHIRAYGKQCPSAQPIIHLGATSCYVGDNTDIIIMRDALELIRGRVVSVIRSLADFALKNKALPTLGYTHFQPAQPVTVGKRACLWINELLFDLSELNHRISSIVPLGCKGTTGTQASFLELFEGDYDKVLKLDELVSRGMGFESSAPVSGQTYSRKLDYGFLSTLSGIAQSASKFATDMRLLSHLKELEEPFEESQVGSSAMPYKRNPMRCERICSLARYVISDAANPAHTAATQWLERTLDDSANRRISIPEAALAADAILRLYSNVAKGIVVNEKVIAKHLAEEIPFMATENLLMDAVKRGGDRQLLHERIREHSINAGENVKKRGLDNDLVERIAEDTAFGLSKAEILEGISSERFTGCCEIQVERFISDVVYPATEAFPREAEEKDLSV